MQSFYSICFFALGAILASFTGVIAERAYTGQSWLKGRSRCNSCRRTLTSIDLVPILSWIAFTGKCRTCRARVPGLYAFFEVCNGLVFMLAYRTLGFHIQLPIFLVSILLLLFIVMYDIRHTIVPWFSSIWLFIFTNLFAFVTMHSLNQLEISLGVAAIIGIGFLLLHFFSKGRAVGLGDAPVAFSLSVLVGAAALPGLVFSFWVGALIGIVILVFRRGGPKMGIEIPFVPFLAIGYLLAFFTQWNPFI
jgi:leader peptidase (prepilin peptidase)/N-methyltransferase